VKARHALTVAFDEDDTPQQLAALRAIHSLRDGVVVCEPAPLTSSLQWLVGDILAALGKRDDFTGAGRNAKRGWARAIMWLIAEQVNDLVVPRAGTLAPAQWVQLCEISAICQIRLWLVVLGRPMTTAQSRVTHDWPFRHIRYDQLPAIGRRTSRSGATTTGLVAPLPDVPNVDFTAFRAVCRRTLTDSDFARIDSVFCQTAKRLRRELGRRDELQVNEAARICCREVEAADDANDALTRLRATQCVLFDRGILVRIRVPQLMANAPQRPLDEAGANALRGYAATEYACLGALVLAYGISPYALASLSVAVITDQGELESGKPSTPVTSLMIAHRLQRAWDGAQDTEPLFGRGYATRSNVNSTPPPAGGSSLYQRYRAVGRDTGLFTPGRWIRHVERSPVVRAAAYGITIHPLEENSGR
jgi:hypothetical protein